MAKRKDWEQAKLKPEKLTDGEVQEILRGQYTPRFMRQSYGRLIEADGAVSTTSAA